MATNLKVKMVKSADSSSFVALAFLNIVEYHNSDFNRLICNDLATLGDQKKFGERRSSNSKFKSGKKVHPSSISRLFGYVCLSAPLLDLAGTSSEFCGAISTQFCFSYSLGCVTTMPHWLHAGLCHAFLGSKDTVLTRR